MVIANVNLAVTMGEYLGTIVRFSPAGQAKDDMGSSIHYIMGYHCHRDWRIRGFAGGYHNGIWHQHPGVAQACCRDHFCFFYGVSEACGTDPVFSLPSRYGTLQDLPHLY